MTEWIKTTGIIWDVGMEKDGACKMDIKNKKCSCAIKSGRRKNNAGTDKEEEKKLTGTLAKKELSAEGSLEEMIKGGKFAAEDIRW